MKKDNFIKSLGLRIRKIRIEKDISLYRLAKNTKKKHQSISRMELGEITPSVYYLYEIADGLGVELEELVKGLP